jgi:apolipoprotein N-acyltransferase
LLFLPAVIVRRPRWGLTIAGALIVLANAIYPGDPLPLQDWEAADTIFGRGELELPDPVREFTNAEWIQQRALRSHARVIVFPETVVPKWNDATEAFWEPTLQTLAANGKTVILGTTVAVPTSPRRLNSVIIRGASANGAFFQRVPVPISMWKPFSDSGFPLRLSGPGSIPVADERAGVMICYELLLTWPILSLSLEHPTILVGVANDYWASGTSIPAIQGVALSAWARLFWLPKLMAVNT